jgi:hypothetical protein
MVFASKTKTNSEIERMIHEVRRVFIFGSELGYGTTIFRLCVCVSSRKLGESVLSFYRKATQREGV